MSAVFAWGVAVGIWLCWGVEAVRHRWRPSPPKATTPALPANWREVVLHPTADSWRTVSIGDVQFLSIADLCRELEAQADRANSPEVAAVYRRLVTNLTMDALDRDIRRAER